MNIAVNNVITPQDVVRAEQLIKQIRPMQDQANAVYEQIHAAMNTATNELRKAVNTGLKTFADDTDTRLTELRKELALVRVQVRQEEWQEQLRLIRSHVEKLAYLVSELEAADALSGLLGSSIE